MKIVHPFAFPVFVFQLLQLVIDAIFEERHLLQLLYHLVHRVLCIKQAHHHGVGPVDHFARHRLVNRGVMCIKKTYGLGAPAHQHIADLFGFFFSGANAQLDPGHNQSRL